MNRHLIEGHDKLRKVLIYILAVLCAGIACTERCFAFDLTRLTARVEKVLPENWQIIEAESGIVPRWAKSQETCTRLTLAGPVKSGYRFFDDRHQLILYQDTHREAVYLWIAELGYNSGWTLLERIKNRFRVCPSFQPKKVTDKNFKVFGINGWHIFDHSYTKESPKGTLEARFKAIDTSWPGWKRDLETAFQYVDK